MADKNFKVRNGLETPLIASNTGQTAITVTDGGDVLLYNDLKVPGDIVGFAGTAAISIPSTGSGNDVFLFGDLTVNGNDIKSSTATALTLDGANVTVQGDLFVAGNGIFSNGGYQNLQFTNTDVEVIGDLTVSGDTLFLKGSTSGTVGLKAAATAGSTTYTLPSADGTANQVLKTNGTGTLSWATVNGSSTFKMGTPWAGGGSQYDFSIPGISISPTTGTANSWLQAAQRIDYQPIYVQETISLTDVGFYVSVATTLASCNAMIYIDTVNPNASTQWQPTGHLSGGYCGEITNITTTGFKSITMGTPITLTPGYYLVALQLSNYTGTLNLSSVLGRLPHASAYTLDRTSINLTASTDWTRAAVAYVSGTPAAIGNWTPANGSVAGHRNPVLMKWTVV
jgi:hypothetical protein